MRPPRSAGVFASVTDGCAACGNCGGGDGDGECCGQGVTHEFVLGNGEGVMLPDALSDDAPLARGGGGDGEGRCRGVVHEFFSFEAVAEVSGKGVRL